MTRRTLDSQTSVLVSLPHLTALVIMSTRNRAPRFSEANSRMYWVLTPVPSWLGFGLGCQLPVFLTKPADQASMRTKRGSSVER